MSIHNYVAVEGVETVPRRGYNLSRIDPADLDRAVPFSEYAEGDYAETCDNLYVGWVDGEKVFLKHSPQMDDDIINSHIASSIVMDETGLYDIDIAYHEPSSTVLVSEVDGVRRSEFDGEINQESLHEALAFKLLVGNSDFFDTDYYNVLYTEDRVEPVDFDVAGRSWEATQMGLQAASKPGEVDLDQVYSKASNISRDTDLDLLEKALRGEDLLEESWESSGEDEEDYDFTPWLEGSIDNILDCFRTARSL